MLKKDQSNIRWGMILSYVGLIVSLLGTLLTTDKVLDYIGDYNYGLYTFVNSLTTWLTVITAALNASFVRFSTIEAKKNNGDSSKINTLYIKLFLIIDIFIIAAASVILCFCYFSKINIGQYDWTDSCKLYGLFALSVINIVISIPTTLYSLYITYRKNFIAARIVSITVSVINFIGHFLIAYFTRSVVGIAIFTIIITIFTALFNYYFSKKYLHYKTIPTKLSDNKFLIKSIALFSGIIVFNTIVDQINSNVDKTILGIMNMPKSVTIYQIGHGFATHLVTMSTAISGVYVPTINELVVDNHKEELNSLYLKISKMQLLIVSFVAFGFVACGHDFVVWWVGSERIQAYYIGAALMILSICPLSINASIEIQRARNKHLFRAITYFICALANVGLSVFLIQFFSDENKVFGCVLGTVITTICSHWISMNIYNKKKMDLPVGIYIKNLIKYLAIGTVSVLGVFCVNNIWISNLSSVACKFLLQGCIYVIVYCGLAFMFDKEFIFNFLKRNKT